MKKTNVFRPPVRVQPLDKIIFLAGPIQGAKNWHLSAIRFINEFSNSTTIASPRCKNFGTVTYETQVDWETYHLAKAGQFGVVMFWLAKEHKHNCKRAYAQTSRLELGEWRMRHKYEGAKLVLGIEPGFTNERYIRRRFSQDHPEIPIFSTLKKTCEQAVILMSL